MAGVWTTKDSIPLPVRASGADLSGKEGYAVKLDSGAYVLADSGAAAVGILVDGGAASGDDVHVCQGRVKAVFHADHTATHLRDISVEATNGKIKTSASTNVPVGNALESVDVSENPIGEIWFMGGDDEATA